MKAKKFLLTAIFSMAIILAIMAIGKKSVSGNDNVAKMMPVLTMENQDTIKPEAIREEHSTQIEIINGKKHIKETIVKMIGDSIVEKKVIEREEDLGDNGDIQMQFGNGNGISGHFQIQQFDQNALDSVFKQFFGGKDIFDDSLFTGMMPKRLFDFRSHFDNFDDGFMQHFKMNPALPFDAEPDMDPAMPDFMEYLTKRFNFEFFDRQDQSQDELDNAPKSMQEIIRDELLNDGFITDIDEDFKFDLNEKRLKINGKKQDQAIYEKYKNLIEDNTGVELEGKFEYKYNNKQAKNATQNHKNKSKKKIKGLIKL